MLPVSATRRIATTTSRRFFGGHAHVEYTGAEAVVRRYLPENHHLVYAILGLYGGIALLVKANGSRKEANRIAALPKPTELPDFTSPLAAPSGIPGIESPEFEAYIEAAPENLENWIKSVDQ